MAKSSQQLQQITEKTDGVPLFVEEITKSLLESGQLEAVDGHYELTGECLLCQVTNPPAPQEAEACFHQALATAHRQQTRSLELRAAMSLGRLWQQQGKQDEARALLAPIYGWFTEGFDTADLQEAQALLDALA